MKHKGIRKADLVVVGLIAVTSIILLVGFFFSRQSKGDIYVSIQLDGKEIQRIPWTPDQEGKTFDIKNPYGKNILVFDHGKVRMEEADCPDKLCIYQGSIHQVGQMIVCLPHRLVVEIKSLNHADQKVDTVLH